MAECFQKKWRWWLVDQVGQEEVVKSTLNSRNNWTQVYTTKNSPFVHLQLFQQTSIWRGLFHITEYTISIRSSSHTRGWLRQYQLCPCYVQCFICRNKYLNIQNGGGGGQVVILEFPELSSDWGGYYHRTFSRVTRHDQWTGSTRLNQTLLTGDVSGAVCLPGSIKCKIS